MAILDTFYLLFKSDTSELKKGAEEAERVAKNLDGRLQQVGRTTEHIGASFLKMANSAANFLAAAVPTAFFSAGIHSAIEMGVEISKTSRLLNVNVDDLQAWGNAVELAGGNAKSFEGTLVSLGEKFGLTSQQVLKVLPKYADALNRVNPARAQQIGKMLGLDEGTILLLQQGSREVAEMVKRQKDLNVITNQNKELFLQYDKSVTTVKQAFSGLFLRLAVEALPILIKIAEKTKEWIDFFIQHKDFVIGGILGISAAMGVLAVRLALVSLPLTLMSLLIVGLIGLFALIYDDIQAFNHGQRSILGYLINTYPNAAQAVYNAFKLMRAGFHILEEAADKLMHPLRTLEEALRKIQELAGKAFGYIGDKLGIKMNQQNSYVIDQKVNAILRGAQNGGAGGTTITNHIGDVHVNAPNATDSKGISTNIKSSLDQQLAQTMNYYADGVLA